MNAATLNRLSDLRLENDGHRAIIAAEAPRFDRMANRHENGSAPRAVVAYQLFQTPRELAERMAIMLPIHSASRILEPSAGLGRLVDAVMARGPREVVAVEIAPACAAELYRINRPLTLMQRDFLTVTPQETDLFDAVAMNPPFHMRSDIRHIRHALTFLKPGGRLVALCLDTHHRETALRPRASTWERIPAGVFGKEGTNVPTVLATFNL